MLYELELKMLGIKRVKKPEGAQEFDGYSLPNKKHSKFGKFIIKKLHKINSKYRQKVIMTINMPEFACEKIYQLNTPVGYFFVTDGNINIPFSVRKYVFDVPYHIYNDNNQIVGEINTETKFYLVIDVNDLKIGSEYRIGFSKGTFSYGGGDEHTESIVSTIGKWSVGIGSYNPNDEVSGFDESKFVRYTVSFANELKNGFEFKLLDCSHPEIVFTVAWIENNKYAKDIYEDALDFWLA